MELLRGLIEVIHQQGETAAMRAEKDRDVRVAKLTEEDDIEAYLTTFERLMTVYEIPEERWVFKLAPQLVGKAQQAYAALGEEEARDSAKLKTAILRRYDINEETYRQRFRSTRKISGETNRQLVARLYDLASRWMLGRKTVEELKDLVILEQLLAILPEDVRIWVKERKPKSSIEAGQLADDYMQARQEGSAIRRGELKRTVERRNPQTIRCYKCQKLGHIAKDCPVTAHKPSPDLGRDKEYIRQVERPKRDLKYIECFNCHQKGHYSSNCPHNAMYCTERKANYTGTSIVREWRGVAKPGVVKPGFIEGKYVSDILLDTECSRTLVRQDLVPEKSRSQAEVVAIRCAHGDTVLYPLAQVQVKIDGYCLEVEAAVSDTLPTSMLLGTDVPEMVNLLGLTKGTDQMEKRSSNEALMTTTRAQAKLQMEDEENCQLKQVYSGIKAKAIEKMEENKCTEEGTQEEESWMFEFDDKLFGTGRQKPRLTRSEKRAIKQEYRQDLGLEEEKESEDTTVNRHAVDIGLEELKTLQETDSTLDAIRRAIHHPSSKAGTGFFKRDGLMYRQWAPLKQNGESTVEQLVLPLQCRKTVLNLAHTIPLSGHLGKDKTARPILQRFYWPTIYKDVADFCRRCEACQKTARHRVRHAPLVPLPIISEPFERIAMDIVGPLPKSRSGKRYILVVCDYATRYPEAIPLKSIDAECIAEELVTLFSRVGVPKEILTDQGSNFTSQLLTEIYRMLHVHPIRTTPYHPQTDGLVERFNQTLKAMLRKTSLSEGKDWDKLIPYLLFAYREVPQASTGFSPFELLYGRSVRGPLDVLKEAWESEKRSKESVVSHVLSVRDKLDKMSKIVQQNLSTSQRTQKRWYDQNAREREFQLNETVLVLLPTVNNKLLAQWQGPYQIVKRIGKVNYLIDMHDRRKRQRVFHVNMLRKWHVSPTVSLWAEELSESDPEDDVPIWNEGRAEDTPKIGDQLNLEQQSELQELLRGYQDVFQNIPGRTNMTQHNIVSGSASPVKLPPYRLPYAYRDTVKQELEKMLASGIIEPSCSEWSAPIVLIKKKDGSLRLCVDYRRLNAVSETDAYPMPRIDDLIDQLGKATVFSTIDLTKGYWQVPVAKEAQSKTAFATPFGLYQFNVMPFGLQGAPATFQRLMNRVLNGLEEFSGAYLDDLIIFSRTWDEHLHHLSAVLDRIRAAGLTAKMKKCQFGTSQCLYLGHMVGGGNVSPDLSKMDAVSAMGVPKTKKQVRTFLGLTGYYRRFIPNYSSIAAPLTDLTRKSAPNQVTWKEECDKAFHSLKKVLCSSPILCSPDFIKPFFLQTDASERGVGAVLSQRDDDGYDHPISYFSRKLLPREQRYSTVEKECLAIKLGEQAFKVYLLGRKLTIQTDHRSLVWLDRLKEGNSRLTRWSLALQPYDFEVTHRAGNTNQNADALSRIQQTEFVAGEGERSVMD